MPYEFKKANPHKQLLQTEQMKVPALFHLSEELLPNDATIAQIESLASDERLAGPIAAMSDVHSKPGRKNPTGTVVATKNDLLPQINDTAPNCGMRLLKTGLNKANFSPEQIEQLFQELVKTVPTKKYVGSNVSFDLALDICRQGIAPLHAELGAKIKNEVENSYRQGNFFQDQKIPSKRDILDAVPRLFVQIGKFRLGILGAAGNHFLDLMEIGEILNPEVAAKFGLKSGDYVFLLHTGSGLLGQYASYMYTPKRKEHLSQRIVLKLGTWFFDSQLRKVYARVAKKVAAFKDRPEYLGYEQDTMEGQMFLTAHRASANFGFANRTMISHHIAEALEKVLGHNPELELLYDTTHISIEQEEHLGQTLWIHRNGSVRANGPARMANHPLFSQTGEPVFIPSSMSTPAYLGVGTDHNESAYFSAPHGTGRRKIAEDGAAHDKNALLQHMQASNVKLYNAKSKGVVLQDGRYYKDVEEVIKGLEENRIIKAVAKMQPVAVLMY